MLTKKPNQHKDCKIKVFDSLMGSGKTHYVIELMNRADSMTKFIYVTPYLDEVERIQNSVTSRTFKSPDKQHGRGRKYNSFKRLVSEGESIVTTHSLFSRADDDLLKWLKMEDYVLIIDEVMDVLNIEPLRKNDMDTLINSELIEIREDAKVIWKATRDYDSKYNDIKELALSENLHYVNKIAFIWNFPVKIFKAFSEIYVLTYMFDGQLQRYYYDLHGVDYGYFAVQNGKIIPRSEYVEDRTTLKQLISVYEGKLNNLDEKTTALSKTWFDKSKNAELLKKLKNNLYNYFRNITKAKTDEILWTTFKDYESKLRGKGYSCGFTPWNLRATNEKAHTTVLAYCLNRYMNPESQFFKQNNVKVDEELLALSTFTMGVPLWGSERKTNSIIYSFLTDERTSDQMVERRNIVLALQRC